jgi:hypothetical protein
MNRINYCNVARIYSLVETHGCTVFVSISIERNSTLFPLDAIEAYRDRERVTPLDT